jgi:hypothetical protein
MDIIEFLQFVKKTETEDVYNNILHYWNTSDDDFKNQFSDNKLPNDGTYLDEILIDNIKQDILKSPTKHFIETGTQFGSFCMIFSEYSNLIETCEIDFFKYMISKYRLAKYSNINLEYTNSKNFLHKRKNMTSDTVFFLDAHGGGYDLFNDNPLSHELEMIYQKSIKPIIYIHDFAVELEDGENDGFFCDGKMYRHRFDFNEESGWKLNWEFIKNGIHKIYGDSGFNLQFAPKVSSDYIIPVGWVRISGINN